MPTMNLEKIYKLATSPYRSFNFQQHFFYDNFLRNAYFTSYRSSKYMSIRQHLRAGIWRKNFKNWERIRIFFFFSVETALEMTLNLFKTKKLFKKSRLG